SSVAHRTAPAPPLPACGERGRPHESERWRLVARAAHPSAFALRAAADKSRRPPKPWRRRAPQDDGGQGKLSRLFRLVRLDLGKFARDPPRTSWPGSRATATAGERYQARINRALREYVEMQVRRSRRWPA